MKTVNVSNVMKIMNEWCEQHASELKTTETTHKPVILCYGAFTLPITEKKLTYEPSALAAKRHGYTVEICGIDINYKINDTHYTKHITINTLAKIFDCERLFIKNIRDKNDCYIVNDRKPRLIRIYANTESFINNEGKNVEYVPYNGELLSSLQLKVYKALKNKYDTYINELNNEFDICEITDDMI